MAMFDREATIQKLHDEYYEYLCDLENSELREIVKANVFTLTTARKMLPIK